VRDLRNILNIELARAKGAYLEDAPPSIWEDGWALEQKVDGIRVTLQIGGSGSLLVGRNRQDKLKGVSQAKEFRKQFHPELQSLANSEFDFTLLDGELTEGFKKDGTFDKYTLKRIANGDFRGLTVWAPIFIKGEDIRATTTDIEKWELAGEVVEALGSKKVRLVQRLPATRSNLSMFFSKGYEGAIAKKNDATYPVTSITNPFWWKLKGDNNRTVDAFIIGVTEASEGGSGLSGRKPKKNGKAATFEVAMMDKGKAISVGKMSNLPEVCVLDGFKNFEKYKGRVVEMIVSGWDGTEFRFPRFKNWRPDKTREQCDFSSQLTGGQNG